MSRPIPQRPNLEFDRKAAKALLRAYRAGDAAARDRFAQHHPRGDAFEPKLADALLVIAREYGFASWPRWKQFVETRQLDRAAQAAALVKAACSNDVRRAAVLLEADPSLAEHDIAAACACGSPAMVERWLREHRDQVNQRTGPSDWHPLQYACFSRLLRADAARAAGIVECARLLLDAGADPNLHHTVTYPGHEGEVWPQTNLYAAAGIANNAVLTRLLLDAGADVNEGLPEPAGNEFTGGELLYHTSEFRDLACLRMVLEAHPHPARVAYCLGRMLDFDHHEGVLLYLQYGADPNARINHFDNRTHLQHAIARGRRVETIAALLDAAADINATDSRGLTPLDYAVHYERQDIASLLRERGATGGGSSAPSDITELLCLAANRNDVPTIHRLLDAGADINATDRGPYAIPPLHWAAWRGRFEATRALIDRGADIHQLNGYGGDALGTTIHGSFNCFDPEGGPGMKLPDEAMRGDYAAIVELLIARGAKLPQQIWGGSDGVQNVLRRHAVPDPD